MATLRGGRHRPAGTQGGHARRRPQLQALLVGPPVRCHHHAQPPGTGRRPRHRRRAARPDGSPRRSGRAHPRGAADLHLSGHRSAAQEAPPRRGTAALPRRLPLPGPDPAHPLRRHQQGPPHPGPVLLHRLRDPFPDGRDGRVGDIGHRHRVRDAAGGRGARAPADRRAQAPLQPALQAPREDPLRQAHPRALATAVTGLQGARRRRRLPRSLRLPEGGPVGSRRAA